MASMGFTKAPSFVVRVGYVPMEPAARLATSHANCAAADRGRANSCGSRRSRAGRTPVAQQHSRCVWVVPATRVSVMTRLPPRSGRTRNEIAAFA